MIQPKNKLPWIYKSNKETEYTIESISKVPICHLEDVSDNDYAPEGEDAIYIVEACNKYPILVEALERLESVTTDEHTADTIKKLLKDNQIW